MKVAVVTPTIASPYLDKCLLSVADQTYADLTHYIFADGRECWSAVSDALDGDERSKVVMLEDNIGKGWYGHRVYAACSFLVNADIICYLDEDNWIEPNHVQSLVDSIKEGNQWAFSLRKIVNKEGDFLAEDNCESLGKWPTFFDDNVFHIDTSCFAVLRSTAISIGHSWYGQWGADRQFFNTLKQYYPNFGCTGQHTLNYRLDGNPNSVKSDFFEHGNKIQQQKYNGEFPWKTKQRSLQVGPGISVVI